jgi:hypothetical protein
MKEKKFEAIQINLNLKLQYIMDVINPKNLSIERK